MITELATTIYNTLLLAVTGKTYADNVFYRHLPDYTDLNNLHIIYDLRATDFPETLDNHKLNRFNVVVTIMLKPEIENLLYSVEKAVKNAFSTLNDDHMKAIHISNTNKTYNELLDIFEKKINITLTYVQ